MKRVTSSLLAAVLAMAACSSDDKTSASKQGDLGTGLNTVDRQYAKSAVEVWDAAVASVKSYDLKIESDRHDSLGGEIQARRAAGEKVNVRIRSLDDRNASVSVRVDPGNRNMAEMIHEKIADKLGIKEAKSAFFGGNTVEGTFSSNLDTCLSAAECAARKLNLTVTNRENSGSSAILDAREVNSNPVQFKLKKVDEGTKVTFIAGRDKNDATQSLAARMKQEFESCLVAGGN